MVGRDVLETIERAPQRAGADGPCGQRRDGRERPRAAGPARRLARRRRGEIVGIAAVAGNGQSELAQVITACGVRRQRDGQRRGGRQRPAGHAIRQGVAHVPEDRTGVGSSPNLSVADNLIMKRYRDAPVARGWFIDDAAARALAQGLKDEYAIAAPSIDTQARLLSGATSSA
jgi:simple sugar transport system ATP-binding protein